LIERQHIILRKHASINTIAGTCVTT
jgi:hypothetical protein